MFFKSVDQIPVPRVSETARVSWLDQNVAALLHGAGGMWTHLDLRNQGFVWFWSLKS